MGSKLTLVLCCAAMAAFTAPADAQSPQHQKAHAALTHRAPDNGAANAQARAPFGDVHSPNAHEPAQCFIPVDGDHDLGYWGSCSTSHARPVRLNQRARATQEKGYAGDGRPSPAPAGC